MNLLNIPKVMASGCIESLIEVFNIVYPLLTWLFNIDLY